MMRMCVSLFILLAGLLVGTEGLDYTQQIELWETISSGYNKGLRPVDHHKQVTVVTVSLELKQLLHVDGSKETMTLIAWIKANWTDQRLTWKGKGYSQLTELFVNRKDIWTPDFILHNGDMSMDKSDVIQFANLQHDGQVETTFKTRLLIRCKLDMKFFPFDQQKCSVELGPWIYSNKEVRVTAAHKCGDLDHWLENGQWDILSYTSSDTARLNKAGHIKHLEKSRVDYHFVVRRRPLFFLINLVFPTMQVVFLSLFGFFTPSSTGGTRSQKILIALVTMMSLTALLLVVTDQVPTTSKDVPLISLYYYCMMFATFLAGITTPSIISVQRRGSRLIPERVVSVEESRRAKFFRRTALVSRVGKHSFGLKSAEELFLNRERILKDEHIRERYPHVMYLVESNAQSQLPPDLRALSWTLFKCATASEKITVYLHNKAFNYKQRRGWELQADAKERLLLVTFCLLLSLFILLCMSYGIHLGWPSIRTNPDMYPDAYGECFYQPSSHIYYSFD